MNNNTQSKLVDALKYARRFLNDKDHDVAFIDKALSEAQSADVVDGWRPIETAPKDGTKIDITYQSGERVPNAWFSEKWNCWVYMGAAEYGSRIISIHCNITHWMPLPPAPKEGE